MIFTSLSRVFTSTYIYKVFGLLCSLVTISLGVLQVTSAPSTFGTNQVILCLSWFRSNPSEYEIVLGVLYKFNVGTVEKEGTRVRGSTEF